MTILYEDNHLLAINKPAGWLVQGDKTGDQTITDWGKEYLKEKYAKPGAVFLHPSHRIDRPVSGAVLLARTDKALSRLNVMFRDKKVQKTYLALVIKAPAVAAGTLRHFLLKDERRNVVDVHFHPFREAKESITEYETIGELHGYTLLRVSPITGQIPPDPGATCRHEMPHFGRFEIWRAGTIAGCFHWATQLED
jgi:23S rRNA pseudouridine1911/1915/1917 synthase